MKKLKVLMLSAHPDDNEIRSGATALKYVEAGHEVRFLSVSNGNGGHQSMSPDDIRLRRYYETREIEKRFGIKYDVWQDVNDCEVEATLELRKRVTRYIREYDPDIIFTHRTVDYHADHRAVALLVQDASYLLVVPNFCPDTPALKSCPVIMFTYDIFANPPFTPDVVIGTDDIIDKKYEMYDCHESQMYEWLPFTKGGADEVPLDKVARREWLRCPRAPRDRKLTADEFNIATANSVSEYREHKAAAFYEEKLVERYGEKGRSFVFAEAFMCSEYGARLTDEKKKELFPF